jgi:hypothetical protein
MSMNTAMKPYSEMDRVEILCHVPGRGFYRSGSGLFRSRVDPEGPDGSTDRTGDDSGSRR